MLPQESPAVHDLAPPSTCLDLGCESSWGKAGQATGKASQEVRSRCASENEAGKAN